MDPNTGKQDTVDEMRLLLIGCSGAGKSATGNSILMKDAFNESDDPVEGGTPIPVTRRNKHPSQPNKMVIITDTPDLVKIGSDLSTEKVNLMGHVSPGPHAILFVISAKQRISQEIQETIKKVYDIFGRNVANYMIVVFTHTDELRKSVHDKHLTSIDEHVRVLETKDTFIQDLLQKVKNRYVGFNNSIEYEKKEAQKKQAMYLLNKVDDLIKTNNGTHYTNEAFVNVEAAMKKLDDKTKSREKSLLALRKVLGLSTDNIDSSLLAKIEDVVPMVGLYLAATIGLITGVATGSFVFGALAATGVGALSRECKKRSTEGKVRDYQHDPKNEV